MVLLKKRKLKELKYSIEEEKYVYEEDSSEEDSSEEDPTAEEPVETVIRAVAALKEDSDEEDDSEDEFPILYTRNHGGEELTEPNARWGGGCQAAMITVGSTIFFCNPNDSQKRKNLEIRYSTDYGQTYQYLVTL